ncbi:hypothetical protein Taro_024937 [Colocasia esculenta]|uniref:Uncharacterized protein n=1 Tax=Colocasia esculenta TaxID=4460 RepID=A0A843VAT0_COLES|nr:hypothetical protein [Colocasia esculenta]
MLVVSTASSGARHDEAVTAHSAVPAGADPLELDIFEPALLNHSMYSSLGKSIQMSAKNRDSQKAIPPGFSTLYASLIPLCGSGQYSMLQVVDEVDVTGCFVTGVKKAPGDSSLKLGNKVGDVSRPLNPFSFLLRFIIGLISAGYFVLVALHMWIKDQIFPEGTSI